MVEYLGCCLHAKLRRESMEMKPLQKVTVLTLK